MPRRGAQWHAVWSQGDVPRLLCRLCAPTACPKCECGPPCQDDAHTERPVRLRDTAAQVPPAMLALFPENMASAGFARLEAIKYPPGALGAGVAGPVSIEHLVAFSREVEALLQREGALGVVCSKGVCANVLLLLGAHLVLARGLSAEEALAQLPRPSHKQQRFPTPFSREPTWHAHSLTVKDCLVGLQTAVRKGWLDYGSFDSDEWLRLLNRYDASFTFHLPLKATAGESRRLTFYAMADPVTTVADPGVRPAPPEDGFVSDYINLHRKQERTKSWEKKDERKRPGALEDLEDGSPDASFDRDQHVAWVRAVSGEAQPVARPGSKDKPSDEERARTDSKLPSPSSAALGGVRAIPRTDSNGSLTRARNRTTTWLETVRVRRWGQEQHSRHSPVPVCLVRERGLTTLPEFGTWLRSVGCRRLVQLNRPNEKALPSIGSYEDYFSQWQLQQETLHFDDGSVPPLQVVRSFRSVVEEVIADMDHGSSGKKGEQRAIVVHCAAGLGRTGTLLGALAMDMAEIPGGAWMGWVRMCRPGSIQTLAQEKFLKTHQPREPVAAGCGLLRSIRRAGADAGRGLLHS